MTNSCGAAASVDSGCDAGCSSRRRLRNHVESACTCEIAISTHSRHHLGTISARRVRWHLRDRNLGTCEIAVSASASMQSRHPLSTRRHNLGTPRSLQFYAGGPCAQRRPVCQYITTYLPTYLPTYFTQCIGRRVNAATELVLLELQARPLGYFKYNLRRPKRP